MVARQTDGNIIIGELYLQYKGCLQVTVLPDKGLRRLVYERDIAWAGRIVMTGHGLL